ncbi:MAG: PDZ domain-containing protein [Planctomycetes bacterium]|nr:PDZ domain-containing protein [Planctomycetota bacterium]
MLPTAAKFALFCLLGLLPSEEGFIGIYLDDASVRPKVAEVIPGSPAASAGLKTGDIICAVDGKETGTRTAFFEVIAASKKDQCVQLAVLRGDQKLLLVVRLVARPMENEMPPFVPLPATPKLPGGAPLDEVMVQAKANPYLGLELTLEGDVIRILRVLPDSPADQAGLRAGEQLLCMLGKPIPSPAAIEALVEQAKVGEYLRFTVVRGSHKVEVEVMLAARPIEREAANGKAAKLTQGVPSTPAVATPPQAIIDALKFFTTGVPSTPAAATSPVAPGTPILVGNDFAAASKAADQSGRMLVVVYGALFAAQSQAQCAALQDASVAALLRDCICVYVDATIDPSLIEARMVRDFPTVEVLLRGKSERRHEGYLPPTKLASFLRGGAAEMLPKRPALPLVEPSPTSAVRSENASELPVQEQLLQLRREVDELRAELYLLRSLLRNRE